VVDSAGDVVGAQRVLTQARGLGARCSTAIRARDANPSAIIEAQTNTPFPAFPPSTGSSVGTWKVMGDGGVLKPWVEGVPSCGLTAVTSTGDGGISHVVASVRSGGRSASQLNPS